MTRTPLFQGALTKQKPELSPLQLAARRWPTAAAVISASGGLSYAELAQSALAIAEQLKAQHIKRLGVIGPNSLEQLVLFWACIEAQVLFCPLSWRFPPLQLTALVMRLKLDALSITATETKAYNICPAIRRFSLPRFTPDRDLSPPLLDWTTAANLVLTSGSSGNPKAAAHSLNNHLASALGAGTRIPLQVGDRWLLSLPLFHIGGIAILCRCALAGAAVALPGELPLHEAMARLQPSHLSLVAAQLDELLGKRPELLTPVKALLLGGGAMPASLLSALKRRKIAAFTSYGMTEMSSQITTGPADEEGSSGTLLPGRELRIQDSEIQVRGETLFLGYLEHDQLRLPLNEDGWFATRDCGRLDDAGRLMVTGRLDNMFVCGGENLQPEEIEAALCQHPQVMAALVFALDDAKFGKLPHAMLRCQGDMPSPQELDDFLASRIARFKRPRSYYPWPAVADSGLKPNRQALLDALRHVQQVSQQRDE